jgi:hypothetical protein
MWNRYYINRMWKNLADDAQPKKAKSFPDQYSIIRCSASAGLENYYSLRQFKFEYFE